MNNSLSMILTTTTTNSAPFLVKGMNKKNRAGMAEE